MSQLSAQQLAELLIGIGRAQAALVAGIESAMAGTRNTHIMPQLQNAAHMRDHPEPTLIDLPVRVAIASMGRIPPDPANIARDLERLLGDGGASGAAPAAAAPAGAGGGDSELDFSAKG